MSVGDDLTRIAKGEILSDSWSRKVYSVDASHTRPLIDMDSKSEIELIERLAHEVFNKVIRAGGTITGEHGDGLSRVRYIKYMYGSKIFSLFREIKTLFDPKFIMNPGKKVIQ